MTRNQKKSGNLFSGVYHWENDQGAKEYPRRIYNLIIGLVLVWGFLVDFIICDALYKQIPSLMENTGLYFGLMIGGLVLMVIGILINVKSSNPLVSFIGYNVCVIPMGIVLTMFIYQYQVVSVVMIYLITLIVSAVLTLIASAVPDFFRGLGKGLFISLLVAIVVELLLAFIFGVHPGILDWVVAIIFCGYIGYDWVMAQDRPATLDNAVDSACSLYLDIVNLFIRLLEIFGKSK